MDASCLGCNLVTQTAEEKANWWVSDWWDTKRMFATLVAILVRVCHSGIQLGTGIVPISVVINLRCSIDRRDLNHTQGISNCSPDWKSKTFVFTYQGGGLYELQRKRFVLFVGHFDFFTSNSNLFEGVHIRTMAFMFHGYLETWRKLYSSSILWYHHWRHP